MKRARLGRCHHPRRHRGAVLLQPSDWHFIAVSDPALKLRARDISNGNLHFRIRNADNPFAQWDPRAWGWDRLADFRGYAVWAKSPLAGVHQSRRQGDATRLEIDALPDLSAGAHLLEIMPWGGTHSVEPRRRFGDGVYFNVAELSPHNHDFILERLRQESVSDVNVHADLFAGGNCLTPMPAWMPCSPRKRSSTCRNPGRCSTRSRYGLYYRSRLSREMVPNQRPFAPLSSFALRREHARRFRIAEEFAISLAAMAHATRVIGAIDAIYLPLRGAMATVSECDTEGDLITRIRAITGPALPILASFDMHCNFTAVMERGLDAAIGFKTCPHVDYVETGIRSMEILADTLAGRIWPRLVHRKLRMMTSAEGHDTNTGPMREVIAQLRELETRKGILAATVIAPQAWMDVPETGWSILVVVDGDEAVAFGRQEADRIARFCWDMRERFLVHRTPLAEALDIAAANPSGAKPVVLTDAADAPSAGSYGDSAVVLAALLERPPMRGKFLLTMTDPQAARACAAAGVGSTLNLSVGGAFQKNFFRSVEIEARVLHLIRDSYDSELSPGSIDPEKWTPFLRPVGKFAVGS